MVKNNNNDIIKKALLLETAQRTQFLQQLEDGELKQKIEFLLKDDEELTRFAIETSAAAATISTQHIEDMQTGDKIKQFVIVKLIAKGGMGSVYLAYDEKLKRNVAIKTIRSEYIKNEVTKQRFKQEAQILSQINHPSICQIYDYITFDNIDVLVLELVQGRTLSEVNLSANLKLEVFSQIASALMAAHEKGVIHRDLKPDNIMVTTDNKVKILDFGIAKSIHQKEGGSECLMMQEVEDTKPITKMGTLMGTLLFMSPEQAKGEKVGELSDIYSFGLIIQTILTGEPSYKFENTVELKEKVINADTIISPRIPQSYKSLLKGMLQKEPQNRPTALETQKSLRLIKEKPRKRIKVAFILAFVALLILSLYLKLNHQKQQDESLFISQVKNQIAEVSNTWQRIYFLPIHDISKDVQRLENKTKKIIAEINRDNLLSESQKNYLLAEIYTVDEQYEKAEKFYQSIWQKDKSLQDIALKLAYVKSFLFRKNLYKSSEINNINAQKNHQKLRDDALKEIRQYLDYAKSSQIDEVEASLPSALLLWTTGKIDQAIKVLDRVIEQEDWLFEAYQMKAQIYSTLGNYAYQNNDLDKAKSYFEQARKVYLKTLERGRSFPYAYKGLCEIDFNDVIYAVQEKKEEPSKSYQEGVNACKSLLLVTPTDIKGYHMLTKINYWYGQAVMAKGNDASVYFEQAKKYNQYILDNKADFNAYYSQGNILILAAQNAMNKGINPTNEAERAIQAYKKALSFNQHYLAYINGQRIFSLVVEMKYLYQVGKNTQKLLDRAKSFYQEVELSSLDSRTAYELTQIMVDAYIAHSQYLQLAHLDSTVFLSSALALLEMNNNESEKSAETLYRFAHILFLQAKQSDSNMLAAKKAIEQALSKQSQNAEIYRLAGQIYRQQALYDLNHHKQEIDFTKAIDNLEMSLDINPNSTEVRVELAKTYELQARLQKHVKNLRVLLDLGLEQIKEALLINPNNAFAYNVRAQIIALGIKKNIYEPKLSKEVEEANHHAKKINPYLGIL